MNPTAKKQALRRLTYGVHILTTAHGNEVAAATVTWLSQASFEPPLVMVGLRTDSRTYEVVEKSGSFAVHSLDEGQKEIAAAFFKPAAVEHGRINGFVFAPSPRTGAPILETAAGWFEARVTDKVKRGDHTVVVAEVIHAEMRNADGTPLALRSTGWSYGG